MQTLIQMNCRRCNVVYRFSDLSGLERGLALTYIVDIRWGTAIGLTQPDAGSPLPSVVQKKKNTFIFLDSFVQLVWLLRLTRPLVPLSLLSHFLSVYLFLVISFR